MKRIAPFYVIFAASLWAVDGIVLRPSLYNLPVTLVVFIATTLIALLLTPFMAKNFHQLKILEWKDWLVFFAVALLGEAIGTMAITKAFFYVNHVNLSIVVLIQKLQPLFAISLAAVFLKEKLPTQFFYWGGLAIAGAYFMTFGINLPNLNAGDETTQAALFSLLAAISFSSSTVLSKRALKNVTFEMGTYLRFAFSAVIMSVIVISFRTINSISDISTDQIIIFLLIAFITGGPAIFLYYFGLKKISASVASICELAFPLTAIILEYVLRHHILDAIQWIGAFVLFFGILRVTNIRVIKPKPAG
ncbi:EamA-like transporter family protein [bacterium BMS3Abin03]|nr:EamA-like transporter family protein [bacterium BMS3Abin03]